MKTLLRGHHLICLNFFRGEGYSEDFIKNIYSIIKEEHIEVVEGPDDVCLKCPFLKGKKCSNSEYSDEMILGQDTDALKLLNCKPGMILNWKMIAESLPVIIKEWKTKYCGCCGYRRVCFTE